MSVLNIISLGAGVQSSTMSLMAKHGEITPMPNGAIFADTHAEPMAVYAWLDWLEKQLPFPVYRVSAGDLSKAGMDLRTSRRSGKPYIRHLVPTFTLSKRDGPKMMPRKCTMDFKIVPIQRKLKELARPQRNEKRILVRSWIGISWDEIQRMKHSRVAWIENIHPLIDRRVTRDGCLQWMKEHGYPKPPRSACVFCPFHNSREWRRLQLESPQEFYRAKEFERKLNEANEANEARTAKGDFLHRSCVPIDKVDFRSDVEKGQGLLDGFNNECEGLCGV